METKKDKHIVVKKYLEEHSLVQSNVTSFNNFIETRMQEIIDEISETINNDDFEITLGKIEIGNPKVIEADGSSSLITPAEAKMRGLTYSAPLTMEISVKKDDQIDSEVVEIGKIPVMVKSNVCNTFGMSKEELIKSYHDPIDPGGYFLIKGNERVMIMAEDLAENQPFIETDSKGNLTLKLFSLKGTYRIPILISEGKDGIFNISFSKFKDIPLVVVLKALGMTKESDIQKYIGKETDSLIVNLYEFANLATREDAMMYISEKTNLQGTKKEILDRVKQRIDSYLFPHISQKKEDRTKKAVTLCKFVKQFLIAKENPHLRTEKDHYANKRIRMCGDLFEELLHTYLKLFVNDLLYVFQRGVRRGKILPISTMIQSKFLTSRVNSAMATGSWVRGRQGVSQRLERANAIATIAHLQRISSLLTTTQENLEVRELHPTQFGKICPVDSPEGKNIGLRKHLALLSKITSKVKKSIIDDNIKEVVKLGVKTID